MKQTGSFVQGPILSPLLRFTLPVLLALFLQAMYGAVDLMVVGQFGQPADVSAVSTGSQVMHTVTSLVTGLSMGATVLLGQKLGEGRSDEGGRVLGSAIALFGMVALVLTVVMVWAASPMSVIMRAPAEAFAQTVAYVRICSAPVVRCLSWPTTCWGPCFEGWGIPKRPCLRWLFRHHKFEWRIQHSKRSKVQVLAMDLRISARRGNTEEGDTDNSSMPMAKVRITTRLPPMAAALL